MTDQRRDRDTKHVEELHKAVRVRVNRHRRPTWRVAATVTKKVDHEDAVPFGQTRQEILPQARRRESPVDEHDGLTATTGPEGMAVHTNAGEVDKLASHQCAIFTSVSECLGRGAAMDSNLKGVTGGYKRSGHRSGKTRGECRLALPSR